MISEFKKEGEMVIIGCYDLCMYVILFFNCDYYNDGNGCVYGYDYNDWFDNKECVVFCKFMFLIYEGLN